MIEVHMNGKIFVFENQEEVSEFLQACDNKDKEDRLLERYFDVLEDLEKQKDLFRSGGNYNFVLISFYLNNKSKLEEEIRKEFLSFHDDNDEDDFDYGEDFMVNDD